MQIDSGHLALAATLVEAILSYPAAVYRSIGHPVTWAAALLSFLEQRLNRLGDPAPRRRLMGILAIIVLVAVSGAAAFLFRRLLPLNIIGLAIYVVVASSLIAQRSLHAHVVAVAKALETEGLDAARQSVAMIVGRDTQVLDEASIARAAIESLAENFSDAVVAPIFWMAVAGLPGAAIYKAANTADSMVGHRTPRYEAFGWAAARLDDVLNLPAARLAAVLIALAAPLAEGSARGAMRAAWRDAGRHRSPNAGWPEAAMAGALGLKLGGPRSYGDLPVDGASMGDGRRDLGAADIRRALRLYCWACGLQALLLLIIWQS